MKQINGLLLTFCILFISIASAQISTSKQIKPVFKSTVLFNPLEDGMGYHNYRIPSLLSTKKGTILAMIEGRVGLNSDHAKNDVVLKRSEDNGATWSAVKVVQHADDNVVMNPVMVQADNGDIILCYIYFPQGYHANKRHGIQQVSPGFKKKQLQKIFITKSSDEGKTWSAPMDISHIAKSSKKSLYAISGPGIGISIKNGKHKGRILIPMNEAFKSKGIQTGNNYALYSDDYGLTWKHGKAIPSTAQGISGGNEIQMIALENGQILSSSRSKKNRLFAISNNGGKSWNPQYEQTDLPDTGCMSPILTIKKASQTNPAILMHIGVTGRVDGRKRGNAIIYLSYNQGKTWIATKTLHKKTFDYSSLTMLKNGNIGMLAEYNFNGERASIKYCEFNLAWILSKTPSITVHKTVQKPKHFFKTHPNHKIPVDMVIQKFKVHLNADVQNSTESLTYHFEILQKKGNAHLLKNKNTLGFSKNNTATFIADWYGENIVKVTAKNKEGKIIASTTDTIFVHFSHSQLAGGDINNLDKTYKKKAYITGKIINDSLVYKGMRHLPSDISKGDIRYEGTKHGAYETKEPRVLALKNGHLIAIYHYQVKGSNDAPPGLSMVISRSTDNGKTWTDSQLLMQDINGVVAYASLAAWKDEVHCYFSGGHQSHQSADTYKGVYKIISKDNGKTWSNPQKMDTMTKLLTNKIDTIAPNQSPSTNALSIPNMTWKGKTANAYIVPFYVSPVKFLITLDGGSTWDLFYDETKYPEFYKELNEISWALLEDRTIYIVSRRQSKKGYKNEMLMDLKGNPTFLGQQRKNHKARRCHQGAVKISSGPYKNRIAVASNYSGDREEATVAISKNATATSFDTRFLTSNAAWGYCHIEWNNKERGFVLIGESEPFDNNENVVSMDGGPDRNERFSIECFTFSPAFYETLVPANVHN